MKYRYIIIRDDGWVEGSNNEDDFKDAINYNNFEVIDIVEGRRYFVDMASEIDFCDIEQFTRS